MRVYKTLPKTGIGEIRTSDDSLATPLPIQKKPYVIFSLERNTAEQKEYYKTLRALKLLGLVTLDENGMTSIIVTSNRKVIRAIDLFLSLPEYQVENNQDLINKLQQLRTKCQTELANKPPRQIPPKGKDISKYEVDTTVTLDRTVNTTEVVYKKSNPKKRYVHKVNQTDRANSEIEAFNGMCYQLLLGERHTQPATKPTYRDGQRAGVMSEFIDYTPFAAERSNITDAKIIDSEMVKVWAAAWVEEEDDLNDFNFGFNAQGIAVKIDGDRSAWPVTSKYAAVPPDYPSENYPIPPNQNFTPTKRDISHFPVLKDYVPTRWPGKTKMHFDDALMKRLLKNKKFNDDKFYIFLKKILITKENYIAMANATLGTENLRNKLSGHKIRKQEILKRILLTVPEFQDYLRDNPNVINEIKAEFAQYNSRFTKERDVSLKVNLETVEENYRNLVSGPFPTLSPSTSTTSGFLSRGSFAAMKSHEPKSVSLPPEIQPAEDIQSEVDHNENIAGYYKLEIQPTNTAAAIQQCSTILQTEMNRIEAKAKGKKVPTEQILRNSKFDLFLSTVLLAAMQNLLDSNGDLSPQIFEELRLKNTNGLLDTQALQQAEKKRGIIPQEDMHKYVKESIKKDLLKQYIDQLLVDVGDNLDPQQNVALKNICKGALNEYIDAVKLKPKLIAGLQDEYGALIPADKSRNEINKLANALNSPIIYRLKNSWTNAKSFKFTFIGASVGGGLGTIGGAVVGGLIAGAVIGGLFTGPLAPLGIVAGACLGAVAGLACGFLAGGAGGGIIDFIRSRVNKRAHEDIDAPTQRTGKKPGMEVTWEQGKRPEQTALLSTHARLVSNPNIGFADAGNPAPAATTSSSERDKIEVAKSVPNPMFARNAQPAEMVDYLRKNTELFVEIVNHQDIFIGWTENLSSADESMDCRNLCEKLFTRALLTKETRDEFIAALIGRDETDNECLKAGDARNILSLVENNPQLKEVIKECMSYTFVEKWHQNKDRQASPTM